MRTADGEADMDHPANRTAAAFTLLCAGGYAVVRGGASWLRILSRRAGAGVAVAGLLALAVGTAVEPTPTRTAAAEGTAPVTAAPSASPGTPTTPATPTGRTSPVARPAAAKPTAVQPALAMTCPDGGSGAAPVFGRRVSAAAPYTVTIYYGDGDRYTDDERHLGAVFSHTYTARGSFSVSAVLTDAAGRTATAHCTYTWSPASSAARPSAPRPAAP